MGSDMKRKENRIGSNNPVYDIIRIICPMRKGVLKDFCKFCGEAEGLRGEIRKAFVKLMHTSKMKPPNAGGKILTIVIKILLAR